MVLNHAFGTVPVLKQWLKSACRKEIHGLFFKLMNVALIVSQPGDFELSLADTAC